MSALYLALYASYNIINSTLFMTIEPKTKKHRITASNRHIDRTSHTPKQNYIINPSPHHHFHPFNHFYTHRALCHIDFIQFKSTAKVIILRILSQLNFIYIKHLQKQNNFPARIFFFFCYLSLLRLVWVGKFGGIVCEV